MKLNVEHSEVSEQRVTRVQDGAQKSASLWVDIHCHCLPGLDDGPTNMAQALALCSALAEEGIDVVLATPHQLGRYDGAYSKGVILEKLEELRRQVEAHNIALTILPGADVRVDERMAALIASGEVLTLADAGRHVLLELPHEIFVDLRPLIGGMAAKGVTAILTHPERHGVLQRHPEKVLPWRDAGALFQVTAGSLVGAFGSAAERAGWTFLESGVATIVASDAHDVQNRPPLMKAAKQAVIRRLGATRAEKIFHQNATALLPAAVLEALKSARGGGS